jgi:hypothetical protein
LKSYKRILTEKAKQQPLLQLKGRLCQLAWWYNIYKYG